MPEDLVVQSSSVWRQVWCHHHHCHHHEDCDCDIIELHTQYFLQGYLHTTNSAINIQSKRKIQQISLSRLWLISFFVTNVWSMVSGYLLNGILQEIMEIIISMHEQDKENFCSHVVQCQWQNVPLTVPTLNVRQLLIINY